MSKSYCIIIFLLQISSAFSLAQNNPMAASNGISLGATTVKNISKEDSIQFYRRVKTYVNPVLGGDHPDPTMLKVGDDDFYMCGSSFHFTPFLPILHSKDMVHWQEISRVVPSDWKELRNGAPSGGIWQGAITWFYNSYWIYFSNGNSGGQYFSKAASPKGPWSMPVKVKTTSTTGSIGYDNSVFVDDDGTPYMITKSGKPINRIQKIGTDGHLTGDAINIDWINVNDRYSWAEGPVMFKRNGWYYYSFARDVAGGQFVYRTPGLTSDSTKWEALGNFFSPITDANTGFRVSNHMSAPIQLKDGTWWAIAQSYEKVGADDWSGQGRQSLLHKINWDENDRPWGVPSSSRPVERPELSKSECPWLLPRSDYFDNNELKLSWHFLNKVSATKFTLSERAGWLRIKPDTSRSHVLQKEIGHYYTLVTRVDIDATAPGQEGGIYLTNGNEKVTVKLFSGFNNGRKIMLTMGTISREIDNPTNKPVWLKLERVEHNLSGYYSNDGIKWKQVGTSISATALDKAQPNFNSWVGTSIGLYAEGTKADFDLFLYKDGFSSLPVAGYNNYFGVETVTTTLGKAVTNTSDYGGWAMTGGVDLGNKDRTTQRIQVSASSTNGGKLEVWIDDLEGRGKKIATIPITATGGTDKFKVFSANVPAITGQHDVFLRFPEARNSFYINSIQFFSK